MKTMIVAGLFAALAGCMSSGTQDVELEGTADVGLLELGLSGPCKTADVWSKEWFRRTAQCVWSDSMATCPAQGAAPRYEIWRQLIAGTSGDFRILRRNLGNCTGNELCDTYWLYARAECSCKSYDCDVYPYFGPLQ